MRAYIASLCGTRRVLSLSHGYVDMRSLHGANMTTIPVLKKVAAPRESAYPHRRLDIRVMRIPVKLLLQ